MQFPNAWALRPQISHGVWRVRQPLRPVDLNMADRVGSATFKSSALVQSMVANSATFSFLTLARWLFCKRSIISSSHALLFCSISAHCADCDDCKLRSILMLICEKCHFTLDTKCALLKSPGAYLIQHFTPRHPLKLVEMLKVVAVVLLIFARNETFTATNLA